MCPSPAGRSPYEQRAAPNSSHARVKLRRTGSCLRPLGKLVPHVDAADEGPRTPLGPA